MRLTTLLLLCSTVTLSAKTFSQRITYESGSVKLARLFAVIEEQTGYYVVYNADAIDKLAPVSVKANKMLLTELLNKLFQDLPLQYSIEGSTVSVKSKLITEPPKLLIAPPAPPPLRGRIVNEKGEPLVGATVLVKSSKRSAITYADGLFKLDVQAGDIISVSYVGYETQTIKVTAEMLKQGTIGVLKIVPKQSDLDEAVVVAYGKTTLRSNTGAVTVIKGEQIQNLPNRSFDRSLMGLVPGLLITPGTGQPGGGVSNFVMRGISTAADPVLNSTVRNPLIIIDGMPVTQESAQLLGADKWGGTNINNPLAQINSSDIESISVLQDAAAIALYGAKAGNGVILVTTKRGKAGKTVFNFRYQKDLSDPLDGSGDYLNQQQYLDLLFEAYRNAPKVVNDIVTPWTDAAILADLKARFPVRADGSFYPQPDWRSELYKRKASTNVLELSVSGGTERTAYYLNLEYSKQNGVLKSTGFDRKSMRVNLDSRPLNWLKFGLSSAMSYSVQDYAGSVKNSGDAFSSGSSIFLLSPLLPIRLENGDFLMNLPFGGGVNGTLNPVASTMYNSFRNTSFRNLTTLNAEITLLKNFQFKTVAGIDFGLTEAKEYADPRLNDPATGTRGGRIEEQMSRISNLISTTTLQYNTTFATHHTVGILAGQEAQMMFTKVLGAGIKDLNSPYYDQISSPAVTALSLPVGYIRRENLLSYFTQLNYGFKNKIFVTGTIRADGSSRFGADKRYGVYPSAGFGYVISEEPFMKKLQKMIGYLKFRGSFGISGNAAGIDRFTPYDQLSSGNYQGGSFVQLSVPGNPGIKWEETFSWNIGVDARMLANRVSISANVYRKKTSNNIYTIDLPLNSGFATKRGNLGDIENKGVDLTLTAEIIRSKNWQLSFNGNWSTNKNILLKAYNQLLTRVVGATNNKEGYNFNSFFLSRYAGVNPLDGSPQYYTPDGGLTSDIDAVYEFRDYVGKPQPDGFGSFGPTITYKDLNINVFFYYQYGFQVYNSSPVFLDGSFPYRNQLKSVAYRWHQAGDIGAGPKAVLNNPVNPQYNISTRELYDGDHLRLSNASITYTVPQRWLKSMYLDRVRISLQGNNLALWTKYSLRDPSTVNMIGISQLVYPPQRSYSLTINANF